MKLLAAALLLAVLAPAPQHDGPVGYTDTPFLPGNEWRVHDANRPRPPVVTPGPVPVAPAPAPSDATVLFSGTDLSAWSTGDGKPAGWKVENGFMEVDGSGSIRSRAEFGDCQLHLEFATPAKVEGESQGRGNSGVFLMGRYEVQILDSFENPTYADGQCAALYGQTPPLANACRKPGEWQTYDIVFRAPRFDGEKLASPGIVTVFHNGVCVHAAVPLLGGTAHRAVAEYRPHPPKGPIELQDHGNPMRFRNVWVRAL